VHVDRVLEWARQAPSSPQRRNRLVTVRRFALALHAEDAQHEVPPADALGREMFHRRVPYIYKPDEISRLMAATSVLPPGSDRPLTYATLFGLLAVTGMRISEALALRLDDITTDGLVIRRTKFQKGACCLSTTRPDPRWITTYWFVAEWRPPRKHCSCLPKVMF
jgi:integrase